MKYLGCYLRNMRNEWGKSLKQISSHCSVSIDYMSKIEKGQRSPKKELLKQISEYYSIPFESLWKIYLSDEIIDVIEDEVDRDEIIKLVKKRLKNPDYHIHIPNSEPLKKEKGKREYVKGGKNGKIKGFNFYIQPTGKLIKREREELLIKSEEYMTSTIGTELDPSLSDIELMEEWNEFFDEYGMRFPEFKDNWIKENPIPEEMGDKEGNSNSEKKKKIELPDILKTKDSLRSNLG